MGSWDLAVHPQAQCPPREPAVAGEFGPPWRCQLFSSSGAGCGRPGGLSQPLIALPSSNGGLSSPELRLSCRSGPESPRSTALPAAACSPRAGSQRRGVPGSWDSSRWGLQPRCREWKPWPGHFSGEPLTPRERSGRARLKHAHSRSFGQVRVCQLVHPQARAVTTSLFHGRGSQSPESVAHQPETAQLRQVWPSRPPQYSSRLSLPQPGVSGVLWWAAEVAGPPRWWTHVHLDLQLCGTGQAVMASPTQGEAVRWTTE